MAKNNDVSNLLLLFERPSEPAFMPKGDNVVFDVPQSYLPNRFKDGPEIVSKFGESATHVPVKNITLPDMTFVKQLGRREAFSLFIPYHRQLASRLITTLVGMRNLSDFTSASVYCRENLNHQLFIYAYSVALLHRPDTRNFPLPPLTEVFPDKFFDGAIFNEARQESSIADTSARVPIIVPQDYTASDLEEEHRLAYFREDLGINLHHWHWHLVYPTDAPREIVKKDRRGELFYYMHEQIQARYNLERFSNQLARVKRLTDFKEPIPEGYFPKLDSLVASRVWAPRMANAVLRDLNRESDQLVVDIADLERWRERIYDAIHTGQVINEKGVTVPLTEMGGIDILGDLMEASILSINPTYYGNLHGLGHMALALIHDPDNRHLETFGVVGDLATSMRDPAFYRLHAMVDDIFQEHKSTLPRYTTQQLGFQGVRVTGVEVNVTGNPKAVKNELTTFWQETTIDLSRGMDFSPRGAVLATVTHLQHAPFSYKITVENKGPARVGTVRIFLGPKADERGLPMLYRDHRLLFIELDTFQQNLKPEMNVIERRSIDSSVTIPFERTFRDVDTNRPAAGTTALQAFNFCGCGWPDHMLLPKGTPSGMQFQLFVMVSDFTQDRVDQKIDSKDSADAFSFCGIRDKLYPDKRSMGYPFDRQPRDGVETLAQFLTPNMGVQDVTIRFTGERRPKAGK